MDLAEPHSFLVVGTDGVWEFLSELEIGLICRGLRTAEEAASEIVKRARQAWLKVVTE